MSTNYIAPIWRMPENTNKDKLSNYSISFNPADTNYIEISDNILSGLANFSISVWYNTNTLTGDRTILGAWSFGVTQMLLYWDDPDGWRFLMNNGTTSYSVIWGTSTTINTWNHIVVTYNGSTISFYHNNGTPVTAIGTGSVNTNTVPWRIGVDTSSSRYWDGELSQFCLFDYALSTEQITYLYNLNNPMAIDGGKPIQYLPLGDNSNPNADGGYPNISVGTDSVFDFNTSGAWIDCGNNPVFNVGTGDLSISAWVYPTSVSGNDEVCGIGTNGGTRFRLQRRAARIGAYIDSAAGQSSMDGSTTLSINQWYHFVLIKSGVNFFLYLNGSEIPEDTYINSGSFTDTEVAIGQYFGGTGNKWAGELTNIQIWNSALTTVGPNSDLEKLYNNGQPLMTGTQPQENNLQAWYKLNQSANWEATTANTWQIPNAVSAYPQSFGFTKTSGEYIDLDTEDWFNEYNNEITFSVWINKKNWSSTGFEGIISKYGLSGATLQYRIAYPSSAGKLQFYLQGGPSGGPYSARIQTVTLTSAQQASEWLHIIWRHDASTNRSEAIFNGDYTNAISLSNPTNPGQDIAGYPYAQPQTTTPNMIGNVSNGLQPFDGAISNYQRFNSYLDNAAVEALYNDGIPSTTTIAPTNLKAWYKLDNTEIWENVAEQWRVKNNKITNVYYDRAGQSNLAYGGAWFNYLTTTNLTQSRTISLWIKYDINRQTGTIRTGFFNNPSLVFYSTGFREINQASSGIVGFTATGVNLSDGGWHHILLHTRGDSTATDNIAYIDGKLATRTVTGTNSFTFGNPGVGYSNRSGNLPPAAYSFSNVVMYNGDATSNVNTLYNNGTPPEDVSSTNPDVWWKVNSTNSSVTTLEDFSGNNNDGVSTYTQPVNMVTDEWIAESATSSGLTEQSLANNNVSVFNGESSGMTTANLVTSNISRTQPYSNYSFNFDAASLDYFDLGGLQGTALQPSNTTLVADGFSVSAWVNLDDTGSPRTFWQNDGLGSANYYGLIFLMNTGGQLNIGYNNGGTAGSGSRKNYITTAAQITSTGTWYHVVAIYKGIAVTPGLYVNGVEITAFNSPTGSATFLAYSPSAKGSIGIGRNGIQSMEGKISNCACFDRTLTQDEVLNIYNNGVPQDLQTASSFSNNIVAWWPMDGSNSYYEGNNWTIRDLEGAKDGTGVNTGNVDDLVGNAPGSDANGSGVNLAIADLIGNMENSKNNAYSINMADYADGVTNPANSGRSTEVPSV